MGVRARIPAWAWLVPALPLAATALWTASVLSTAAAAVHMQSRGASAVRADLSLPRTVTLRAALPTAPPRLEQPVPPPEPAVTDPCAEEALPAPAETSERFFVDRTRPVVSLTFDDGPSSAYTPRILDVLEHHGVKATFFVLGRRVEAHPDVVKRIAAEGHDLGNHTFSHPSLRSLWKEQIRDEVCRTNQAIEAAAGVRPSLFRPPFGRYAESAVPLLGGLGMSIVLWSADGADWEHEDPSQIAASIVRQAKPGSIILLHDRESVTLRALPEIIRGLRAKGLAIEPVSQAMPG